MDAFNARRLKQLTGDAVTIPSKRWGRESSEWKGIPERLELKAGALVMVLANQPGTFNYVNGDLATFHVRGEACHECYEVETKRGYIGEIPFAIRRNISFNEPDEDAFKAVYAQTVWGKKLVNEDLSSTRWKAIYLEYRAANEMKGVPYFDPDERGVVVGEIEYMPLRVAYASSYHKCISPSSLVCDRQRGIIEASQIRMGDEVATQGGVYTKVVEVARTIQPVCRVTTKNGYVLECSPAHRFPVNMQNLVEARNLVPGDILGVSFQLLNTPVHEIGLSVAYLLGLLIGDGAIGDKKEGNVHFCSYNLHLQNLFTSIVQREFCIHVGRRSDGKGCFFTSKPGDRSSQIGVLGTGQLVINRCRRQSFRARARWPLHSCVGLWIPMGRYPVLVSCIQPRLRYCRDRFSYCFWGWGFIR